MSDRMDSQVSVTAIVESPKSCKLERAFNRIVNHLVGDLSVVQENRHSGPYQLFVIDDAHYLEEQKDIRDELWNRINEMPVDEMNEISTDEREKVFLIFIRFPNAEPSGIGEFLRFVYPFWVVWNPFSELKLTDLIKCLMEEG